MAKTIKLESPAGISTTINKLHRDALSKMMAGMKPSPSLRSMLEYLIEKEAADRGDPIVAGTEAGAARR